jgi:thiol-disulfide isomerase/thioredoxin
MGLDPGPLQALNGKCGFLCYNPSMRKFGDIVKLGSFLSLILTATIMIITIGCASAAPASGAQKQSAKTAKPAASSKKPADKQAADKNPKKTKTAGIADTIGDVLRADNPVFVYFYSAGIKDSLDQLDTVKKVAKKGNAEVVTVKSEDMPAPYYAYDGQYMPTVILLRPEAGLTNFWEMDLPEEEMAAAVSHKIQPNEKQKQIAEAIKKKKPLLLFFMAKWCGYCQRTIPEVKNFERDYNQCVDAVTIDVDETPEMQEPYMINGVPVLLLFDANGFAQLRTGYPQGYERFKEVFEGMSETVKSCMKAPKKSGGDT